MRTRILLPLLALLLAAACTTPPTAPPAPEAAEPRHSAGFMGSGH